MTELFDTEGNPIEAWTAEEVDQKIQEAQVKAIDEANAQRQEEIDALAGQLAEKEKELNQEKNKDKNLDGQRKVIENKTAEVEELNQKLETLKQETELRLSQMSEAQLKRELGLIVQNLAGGDAELSGKILYYYNQFAGSPKDEKERQERLQNAVLLATGGARSPMDSRVFSSAGIAPQANKTKPEALSVEAVQLAKNMGLSEQDLKKHKLV